MSHIHNYEIVRHNANAVVEVCVECKKKLTTKSDKKGRIDNKAYLKEHQRDTAQPTGTTANIFKRFYGKGTN